MTISIDQRLNGLTIIAGALLRALMEIDQNMNSYAVAPKEHSVAPTLQGLQRAAMFTGFWGVGNFLGVLTELARGLESVAPSTVERQLYKDRILTFSAGVKALGGLLRSIANGETPSYAPLNTAFTAVIRKARPALLEVDPDELVADLFMPCAPSLEVDAFWAPPRDSSRESLIEALGAAASAPSLGEAFGPLALANPYRALSGFFEAGACQPDFVDLDANRVEFDQELQRLKQVLESGEPLEPVAANAHLFSRLLYQLACTTNGTEEQVAIRSRYSLVKPGTDGVASRHDVAKKFAQKMGEVRERFKQATLTRDGRAAKAIAEERTRNAAVLESPAYEALAQAFAAETRQWPAEPSADQWTTGAAYVLLMTEAAMRWGNRAEQESLLALAHGLAEGNASLRCRSMQVSAQAAAIQKLVLELGNDFKSLHKNVDEGLLNFRQRDMTPSEAGRVSELYGVKTAGLMGKLTGVFACLRLPSASAFADGVAARAAAPATWQYLQLRGELYNDIARVSLFLARLRPGSLLDMGEDEQHDMSVEQGVPATESMSDVAASGGDVSPSEMTPPTEVNERADSPPSEAEVNACEAAVLLNPEDALAGPAVALHVAAEELVDQVSGDVPVSAGDFMLPLEVDVRPAEVSLDIGMPTQNTDLADQDAVVVAVGGDAGAGADADEAPAHSAVSLEDDDVASWLGDSDVLDPFAPVPDEQEQDLDPDELERAFFAAAEGRVDMVTSTDNMLLTVMFEESFECQRHVDGFLAAAEGGSSDALPHMLAETRRYIHTLKGVVRTVGLAAVGAMLHEMEDALEVMPSNGAQFGRLTAPFAKVMARVRVVLEAARTDFYNGTATALAAVAGTVLEVDAAASTSAFAAPEHDADDADHDGEPGDAPAITSPSTAPGARSAVIAGSSVRIPIELATHVGAASSLLMAATRRSADDVEGIKRSMRELQDTLQRMGSTLRELEMMAQASIASSAAQGGAQGFDPLELDRYTLLQDITRRLVEAHSDALIAAGVTTAAIRTTVNGDEEIAELTDELQRGSNELLLMPVAAQRSRLESVVAMACSDTGKRANLVIEPGSKLPSAAVDKLMAVLEHLLRNSVAHGIEDAAGREAAGKVSAGTITVAVPRDETAEAGIVRLVIRDDGAGIDLDKVFATAVRRGLVKHDAKITDDAKRELLFMHGFSTAGSVSELAGRGVGLDVVRSTLAALGGFVSVSSELGRGAAFTLAVPVDSSSMAVVPVSAAGFKCLLPVTLVRRIVPISSNADVTVDATAGVATVSGVEYEVIDLSRRVPATDVKVERGGQGHLVLMRESNVTKAVRVDTISQQTRVAVMPLGPFVRDIPGFVAGTTLAGGDACLVLNPLRLSETGTAAAKVSDAPSSKRVMVVDDSTTVRLSTAKFIKRCGFAVESARDGLDALQLLDKGAAPDAFCVDLEMPGMDGFQLISELRQRPMFASTPIIVISSRSADKHRDKALALGADRFLAKPYEDVTLQHTLEELVGVAV